MDKNFQTIFNLRLIFALKCLIMDISLSIHACVYQSCARLNCTDSARTLISIRMNICQTTFIPKEKRLCLPDGLLLLFASFSALLCSLRQRDAADAAIVWRWCMMTFLITWCAWNAAKAPPHRRIPCCACS